MSPLTTGDISTITRPFWSMSDGGPKLRVSIGYRVWSKSWPNAWSCVGVKPFAGAAWSTYSSRLGPTYESCAVMAFQVGLVLLQLDSTWKPRVLPSTGGTTSAAPGRARPPLRTEIRDRPEARRARARSAASSARWASSGRLGGRIPSDPPGVCLTLARHSATRAADTVPAMRLPVARL